MFRESSMVVDAGSYQVGNQPYLLSQMTAAALQELKNRRAKKAAAPVAVAAPVQDPEALRQQAVAVSFVTEAKQRLAEARKKADEIIAAAEAEAAGLREKAKEEGFAEGLSQGSSSGYEEGLKKGEDEGMGRWAESVARWQSMLDETVKEKSRYLSDRERILVELSMQIAAKVIAREVKSHPEDIQLRVSETIKRAADRSVLRVHLNPADLSKALEADSASFRALGGVKQIEYLADDKVMRGGVRLESSSETIDAGMDTQLTEIVRGLLTEAFHAD